MPSHHFVVAEAVELGLNLDRLPPKVTIYGVAGERFELGAPVSLAVAQAVERLAEGRSRRG